MQLILLHQNLPGFHNQHTYLDLWPFCQRMFCWANDCSCLFICHFEWGQYVALSSWMSWCPSGSCDQNYSLRVCLYSCIAPDLGLERVIRILCHWWKSWAFALIHDGYIVERDPALLDCFMHLHNCNHVIFLFQEFVKLFLVSSYPWKA